MSTAHVMDEAGAAAPAPSQHAPRRRHRAGRRRVALLIVSLAAVVPAVAASPAYATTVSDLTGTFVESIRPTSVVVRGGFTFITVDNTGLFEGTLNGPTHETGTVTVYPDGTAIVLSRGSCECTFAGQHGLVGFVVRATITPLGSLSGQIALIGESGALRGLGGGGSFQGFGNVVHLSGRVVLP